MVNSSVIETTEQFPKKVCFTLFGDKVTMIEGLNQGEEVEVSFNLESREFNGKWFHNVNAYNISLVGGSNGQAQNQQVQEQYKEPEPDVLENEEDDLPF